MLVSLYVDERKALPEAEQRVEQFGGKDFRVRTVGNKWTYLQASQVWHQCPALLCHD